MPQRKRRPSRRAWTHGKIGENVHPSHRFAIDPQSDNTLGDDMNPRFIEMLMDSLRPGWRERSARRKSPWNLVCVLLGFVFFFVFWFALFQLAWALHVQIHPAHAGLQHEFWRRGISLGAFMPSFLMLVPLAMPALVGGFLGANGLVWLIPAARRAMDAEAAGDREMTFAGANAGLIKWGGLASAACIVLSIGGLAALTSLR